jgi:long-chain acyl-CoA synthetase
VNLASVVESHPDGQTALVVPADRGARSVPPGPERTVVSYGELRAQVAVLRGGLSELGVEPGDRVALVAPNGPRFVATYLAVLGVGAVAVPLNPHSPAPELQRELTAVGARVLVVDGADAARAVAQLDRNDLAELAHVITTADVGDAVQGGVSWDELSTHMPGPLVERDPDDLAVLVFTSGTAGAPRAAMLTHGNLQANIDQVHGRDGALMPTDVVLGTLPLFHIYGLNAVLGVALARGSSVVLVDQFDPTSARAAIQQEGVTVVPGVPAMWAAWADPEDVDPEDFATVRLATSGAAPLDGDVRRTMRDRFGVSIVEGYGLTEASPAVTTGLGVDAPDGSVGVPLPDVALRLVDPTTGDDALVDDPGEIWVKGPNVFPGYWNDAEAGAAALTPDGWLRTGDVAVVDDDGHLFLVDRAKDLIIVSGFNVYPAEVEEIIEAHPAVTEAAVVGDPDPKTGETGETVTAYVVSHEQVAEGEIIAYCQERLARYKCPTKVSFVDDLPHSLTGKIQRRKLQSRPSA